MKEQKHIWEADVRQQVTGHVFEYDPVDWGDMEQLLDQAGPPPPDTNPPPSSGVPGSGLWKTGFFTTLIVVALMVWYLLTLLNPTDSKLSNIQMSSFPMPTIENTTNQGSTEAQTVNSGGSLSNPEIKSPDNIPSNINRPVAIPDKSEVPETLTENRGEVETKLPEKEAMKLVNPLPRSAEIPLLQTSPRPLDFEIPIPKRPKRKRDRRKLYPDVFDNY